MPAAAKGKAAREEKEAEEPAQMRSLFAATDRLEFLSEGIKYMCFILMFTAALYMSRSSQATYRITEQVEETFTASQDIDDGYLDVTRLDDLWSWADARLVPGLFDSLEATYMNRTARLAAASKADLETLRVPGMVSGMNFVVGQIQLHQKRAKSTCAYRDAVMESNFLKGLAYGVPCLAELDAASESTGAFGPLGADGTPRFKHNASTPVTTVGVHHGPYRSGAFTLSLPVNDKAEFNREWQQVRKDFIDLQTRLVLVDVVLFSPNVKLWTAVRFTLEFPSIGGVVPSYQILITPVPSLDDEHMLENVLMSIVVLFVLYYTFAELLELAQLQQYSRHLHGIYMQHLYLVDEDTGEKIPYTEDGEHAWSVSTMKKAFKERREGMQQTFVHNDMEFIEASFGLNLFQSFQIELLSAVPVLGAKWRLPPGLKLYVSDAWNWIDGLNLVVFYLVFYYKGMQMLTFMDINSRAGKADYISGAGENSLVEDVQQLAQERSIENLMNALNIFVCWFRLFKYTKINPRLNQLMEVISAAARNIMFFFFVYFIVTLGFTYAGWLSFGSNVFAFRSVGDTFMTLFRGVSEGELYYEETQRVSSSFATAYYVLYFVLVYFVLINMFIAIITSAYELVERNMKDAGGQNFGAEIASAIKIKATQFSKSLIDKNPAAVAKRTMAKVMSSVSGAAVPVVAPAKKPKQFGLAAQDKAKKGGITPEWFATYLQEQLHISEKQAGEFAATAFAFFDDDHSGYLDQNEVQSAITYVRDRYTVSDASISVLSRVDDMEAEVGHVRDELRELSSEVSAIVRGTDRALKRVGASMDQVLKRNGL